MDGPPDTVVRVLLTCFVVEGKRQRKLLEPGSSDGEKGGYGCLFGVTRIFHTGCCCICLPGRPVGGSRGAVQGLWYKKVALYSEETALCRHCLIVTYVPLSRRPASQVDG